MRTSKISQETTRIFNALSAPRSTRTTRAAAKAIRGFANGSTDKTGIKDEEDGSPSIEESSTSGDIEDAISTSSRKRKRGAESPATTVTSTATETNTTWTAPTARKASRRVQVKKESEVKEEEEEDVDEEEDDSTSSTRVKAKPKIPARKTVEEDGTVTIHPPSNWEEMYSIVKQMRERNPTAPVDTMGCEDLHWPHSPAKDQRYHTLTALMLSSQTKDTVTAVAMHRLHTELVPMKPSTNGEPQPSVLTVENMLTCDPKHLDDLIGKVGFHNNKTRYIKKAAEILRDEFDGDIPNTIQGLTRLPGVGPKMAYLCMSAAWGLDEGIGVDVHVHRITNLWGWHKTKNPEETRAWLESWLPKDRWHHINRMLVGLGQTVCLPVGRRCWDCDLAGKGLCKAEIRGVKVKEEKRKVEVVKGEERVLKQEKTVVKVKEEVVDN